MKLHNVAIIILIVSMIILGSTTYLNSLGDNYDTSADLSGFNKTQKRLDTQENVSKDIKDDMDFVLEGGAANFFYIPYKMIQIGWGTLKLIFGSWVTIEAIMVDTVNTAGDIGLPLPDWLVPSLVAIMLILLVSILVYGFFKWKFED